MSADSELLIKIKTILESQGIDDAKKELDNLIIVTKNHDSAASDSAEGISKSRIEMEKASKAAFALRMAASGSTEGLRGLARTAFEFGNTFGAIAAKATIVFAAFSAGWKIGDVIRRNLIDPLMEIRTNNFLAQMKTDFDELNRIKLDNLKKEVEGIKTSLSNGLTKLDEFASRSELLRAAISERLAVEAAATPEGFERDRAVNEDALRANQEKYIQTRQNIIEKDDLLQKSRRTLEKDLLEPARNEMDEAEKQYNATANGSTESKVFARKNYAAAKERFNTVKESLPVIEDKNSKMSQDLEAEFTANEEKMIAARTRYKSTLDSIAEREKTAADEQVKKKAEAEKISQNELRTARLALLKESFEKETDAQKLPDISKEITSLEISGLPQSNPEARAINKSLIINKNQNSLTNRIKDIAVGKAEDDVNTQRNESSLDPDNEREKLDVKHAEGTLKAVRSGNNAVISRLTGIAAEMLTDQQFLEKRVQQIEQREKNARGVD